VKHGQLFIGDLCWEVQ